MLFHNFDRFLTVYESRFEKEWGMDRAGIFRRLPRLGDSRLAEIFAREMLRLLAGQGVLSPEWAERILSWRHTGFNVHSRVPVALGMLEEESPRVPSRGWAEMTRKVYEVDPMICPRCGGRMRVVAFLTEYAVIDRIIRHLGLTFVAEKPPPAHVFEQVALTARSWTFLSRARSGPRAGTWTRPASRG